jgi:cation transport protein ChaC
MPAPADPFTHLPALRHRLTPAERSAVRATPHTLAHRDEQARGHGLPASWRLSDQQLEDSRRAMLGCLDTPQDLWLFGYGSLMWDPGVHFAEVRQADLRGFERRFSYKTTMGRGTPDCPALTLSLEPSAGSCRGLVFRIAADRAEVESGMVWRREMLRNGYCPTWLPVTTPQGPVTALGFVSNRGHEGYAGDLSLVQAAGIIATACGVIGSNRDYLEQLAAQLDTLSIADPYISQLLQQVQALDAG